jgi:hypothetical protein
MFSFKIIIFLVFFISNCFIATSAVNEINRYRRTLEDVFALVKQDEIWPLLLCDMCIETLKCSRDYCRICSECSNPSLLLSGGMYINFELLNLYFIFKKTKEHQNNDDQNCKYCVAIECKNTKICYGCSVCNQ